MRLSSRQARFALAAAKAGVAKSEQDGRRGDAGNERAQEKRIGFSHFYFSETVARPDCDNNERGVWLPFAAQKRKRAP